MANHYLYVQSYLESAQTPAASTLAQATTTEAAIVLALGRIDGQAQSTPKSQAQLDAALTAALDVSADPFAAYFPSYAFGFATIVAGVAVPLTDASGTDAQVASLAYRVGAQDGQASNLRSRSTIATLLQGIF